MMLINDTEITLNDKGGILHVLSRVSDKKSGEYWTSYSI
jgi:hypothetical protein